MVQIVEGLDWGDRILPVVHDPEWEVEVKADLGVVPDIMTRVAPSLWIRRAILKWGKYPNHEFPKHLADIAVLVVAHENVCRYCYGVARSQMELFGYSGKIISSIKFKS